MLNPISDADGILLDLRYASVDDPLGRAVSAPPAALPPDRGNGSALSAADGPDGPRSRWLQGLRPRGRRPPGGESWRFRAEIAALSMLGVSLAGCARSGEPATFAVPRAAAAEIRMICPPGTFIGTMTANCPQPLSRGAPVR